MAGEDVLARADFFLVYSCLLCFVCVAYSFVYDLLICLICFWLLAEFTLSIIHLLLFICFLSVNFCHSVYFSDIIHFIRIYLIILCDVCLLLKY